MKIDIMIKGTILAGILVTAMVSCDENNGDQAVKIDFSYNFDQDTEGWTGDFADYPAGEAESYELTFEYSMLPSPLDQSEGALKLSGTNMSDDLFMFTKRKIEGLDPNTSYNVNFTVEFASDVPDNRVGVGGSPGESVWIKAGATPEEPLPLEDDMGYYRMNINKGGQSQGGSDMAVLGDFSNDTDQQVYTLKTVTNEQSFMVTSDSLGEVWIVVGTDSGFEATTTIYYNEISASFIRN